MISNKSVLFLHKVIFFHNEINFTVPSFMAAMNPINRLLKKQNRTDDRTLNNSNPFRNLYNNPLLDPTQNPLMN